jgi:hypothetical protein
MYVIDLNAYELHEKSLTTILVIARLNAKLQAHC